MGYFTDKDAKDIGYKNNSQTNVETALDQLFSGGGDPKAVYSNSPFTTVDKILKTNSTSREVIETDIEIDSNNNLDLKNGGLKDTNITTSIKLGDANNTNLYTDNKTIVGSINEVYSNPLSVGLVDTTFPSFTDNGDGTATIGSCKVALYDNAFSKGYLKVYDIASATLSFNDMGQDYIVANYNSGTPIYTVVSNANVSILNGSNNSIIYFVWRVGNTIHSSVQGIVGLGLANKINKRFLFTEPYAIVRSGNLSVAEITIPTNRTVTCTASVVFKGIVEEPIFAFNSSTDNLYEVVSTSTGWTFTKVSFYDNSSYNPTLGGKVAMLSQKYGYRLFYRSIGDAKEMFYTMSENYYTSFALAEQAALNGRSDVIPLVLQNHCLLVGYSIIQYNATNGITKTIRQNGISSGYLIPNHDDILNIHLANNNITYGHIDDQEQNIYGVKNFINGIKINGSTIQSISSGITSNRPITTIIGYQYFDTTIGKPIYWNGTGWIDATGTSV